MIEIILNISLALGFFLSVFLFLTIYSIKTEGEKKYGKIKYENVSILISAYNEEKNNWKNFKELS